MESNRTMSDTSYLTQLFGLDDRVALLTGAAGHLGQAMATGLSQAGATVVLVGRNAEKLAALQARLPKSEIMPLDLTAVDTVPKITSYVQQHHQRLDILINNAYSGRTGTITSSLASDFELAQRLCVELPFRLVQECLPLLKASTASSGASVINIASMYGTVSPAPEIYGDSGMDNPPYYGAAKAGMIQLTRYLACHLAEDNIRVNSISPGPFPSSVVQESQPAFLESLRHRVPMKRIGSPEELAGAVLFLASDASSYVTGVNLAIDGGWTAW
jgi:NAD(P)-dependent dehydrogenase (short-subunit alcohol dehydrogenase family)